MDGEVIEYLSAADPGMARLIAQVGVCGLKPDKGRSPFQGLIQAVAHQQLNGKAAKTILGRFIALFPHTKFPSPQEVQDTELIKITGVGFSRAKAACVKEIARHALEGVVPSRKETERMTDEEIFERLTQIKGIGRWSVEMFLIFGLGRPDVLPIHDYGIQQGFALAFKKRKLPKPERLLKHGERWRPYRTTAAWYLWRALDSKD